MYGNLISISALDQLGFENYVGNRKWKLTKGLLVVARGDACCTLYKMHVKVCKSGPMQLKTTLHQIYGTEG